MTPEENTILNFLGQTPETWYSRREVARKAVHRRDYEENPNWAAPAITSLLAQGQIEDNASGHIKLKEKKSR